MPADLACPACSTRYSDRWRCECGHPLEFADTPRPADLPPDPAHLDTHDGLWAFDDFLPVDRRVSLGEGMTPLVAADEWDAQFKLEYVFPTGSFKDRGATTTLSRALELGVDTVVEDSSGNAGAAIATYAARAGLDAEIYVPASVKDAKLRAIRRSGAEPVRVEGSREDVTDACLEAVREGEGWYASHAWNPAFFAGTATVAYEVAAQRDWTAPDAVVTPLGHGTLFLGAYRGFRTLVEAGWIEEMPTMLGAQGVGYAPFATALHGGDGTADDDHPGDAGDDHSGDAGDDPEPATNDAADGIRIREPIRSDAVLDAIEATGGDAVAVDSDATERHLAGLHEGGFYTEPTSAVAPAGLETYRERGVVDDADDVVVALTGSGLKT